MRALVIHRNPFIKVLWTSVILSIFYNQVNSQTPQVIRFYAEANKVGNSQTFEDEGTISFDVLAYNAKSYCVEEGLWILTIQDGDLERRDWMGGNVGGEICNNRPAITRNYLAVRPVGNLNLEISALHLYPQVRWDGNVLINENSEDAGATISQYRSYVLTGTVNYEIFPQTEFGGTPVCLIANAGAGSYLRYGITSEFNTVITYGSSRPGCGPVGGGDDGGSSTTAEPGGTGGSLSNNAVSAFTHVLNLLLLYSSTKILF